MSKLLEQKINYNYFYFVNDISNLLEVTKANNLIIAKCIFLNDKINLLEV